ncbi:MAG: hypothetical protein IPL26_00060 [Leptospiraceae bacterium]|nr:hypothetical protein [Leptospiraceae bacterium]
MDTFILIEFGIGAFIFFLILNWIKEAKSKRKEVKQLNKDLAVLNAKKIELEETE